MARATLAFNDARAHYRDQALRNAIGNPTGSMAVPLRDGGQVAPQSAGSGAGTIYMNAKWPFNTGALYEAPFGVEVSASVQGGAATAAVGVVFPFLIALIAATVYYAAARKIRLLVVRPFLCGLAYGVGVFVVMQYLVLPLSACRVRPLSWSLIANGVLIDAFGVGLPIALAAAWSARRRTVLSASPSSASS